MIFSFLPHPDNDRETRALKVVGVLAVLAVALGMAFTVGRHDAEGRAFMLMRAHEYDFERRSTDPSDEAGKAAKAFRNTIEQIRNR